MSPDLINTIKSKLPENILKGLDRIPLKDHHHIFVEACGHLDSIPDEIDEELFAEIEKSIRYKDAKIRLIKMMLSTQIKNDGRDIYEIEGIISDISRKFGSDEFYEAYEKYYQGKTMEQLGIIV